MKSIYVTQPKMPPLDELLPYLEEIWDSKILTNNGPFHQRFEKELCDYLQVEHLSLFTNGTLALITALQALRITGEVITTPYSFVATTHALLWNNIKPVFVDIDPQNCNIDTKKIEQAITPQTSAILAVHCYGNPCAVEEIERIADTYGLKVIYDAAHAFGVNFKEESLLKHGDLSILSFHATKPFNTFEGGALVCPDAKVKQRVDYLKNFGFADEVTVTAPGINAKMSEFNSAFGILQLKYIEAALNRRREIADLYFNELSGVEGIRTLPQDHQVDGNASYFPIFVGEKYYISRDDLYEKLKANGVFARRYFYPLISDMPMYRGLQSAASSNLTQARIASQQVICLPIYPDLPDSDVKRVMSIIRDQT